MDGLIVWAVRYLGIGLVVIAALLRLRTWAIRATCKSTPTLAPIQRLFLWVFWPLLLALLVVMFVRSVRRRLKQTNGEPPRQSPPLRW